MELQQIIVQCSAALMTFDCGALAQGDAPVECGGAAPSPPETPSASPPPPISPSRAVASVARVTGLRADTVINE
jgi:hypothetical protein